MKVVARLSLLLLLAAPVSADEQSLIYARQKTVAGELEQAIATVARERIAYASAPNPEAQLWKWGACFDRLEKLALEHDSLAKRHREQWRQRMMTEFAGALSRASHGEQAIKNPDSPLYADHQQGERIEDLNKRFMKTYYDEFGAVKYAAGELAARRNTGRKRRLAGLVVLVVAAGGVIAFLLMRRKTVIIRPLAAPSGPPPIPKLIAGNIEVKGLIGRGAMGEVYEALDKTIGRRVALKRLRPELLASPADLDGLLAEARVVASLKHANLVAIYSVEREAGQVYLVFEFVDGLTLARILEERRRLDWPESLRIFASVCAALRYSHAQRIVHRDLKPANIMLSRTGEVKVMDFGIAFTARKSISRLTRAAAWGTPPYMAPEQELGGVSAGVDLFAASVCLYEMLTGQLPFKGPNFLAQKREGLFPLASSLAPGLPKAVDAFFASALAPEPSKRYPTAAELAAAAAALS